MGRAWRAAVRGVAKDSDMTEATWQARVQSLGHVCLEILQFWCLPLLLLAAGDHRHSLNRSAPQFPYRLCGSGLDASMGVHTWQPLIKD